MKSLISFLNSTDKKDQQIRQLKEENLLLRQEIIKLKEAISPLTRIGIRVQDMKMILDPIAAILDKEIEKQKKNLPDTAFRTSGTTASSPVTNRRY
jgi:hypothetical protein